MRIAISTAIFALALMTSVSSAAEEKGRLFAELSAPAANGWTGDRWENDTIEGTPVCRPIAKRSCYATAKIIGDLPKDGALLATIRYYSDGNDSFSMGIGGWGSPTQQVLPQKKGWQETALGFSASMLKQFAANGTVQMLFTLDDEKAVAIARVELSVPTDNELLTAYREWVRVSTAEAWRISKTREEVLDYDDKEPLNASADDDKRGAIPFLRSYLQFVFTRSVPKPAERLDQGGIRLPPGETAPFQFAIKALRDLPECRVEPIGKLPKGITADVRWLESAPMRWAGSSRSVKWQSHPTRLWPNSIYPTCAVKSGEAQSWWALISVADDAEAKVHPIQLAVKNGADTIATFTINVEVLPFKLPKDIGVSFMMTERGMIESDEILADMAVHGLSGASAFDGFVPGSSTGADFTLWDEYFARLRKHGLDRAFFWYLGNPSSRNAVMDNVGKDAFIAMLKGLNERVKDGRYPKLFAISIDEAVKGESLKALQELNTLMKEHAPLLKCFTASMGDMGACERLVGTIDLLATNGEYHESKKWSDAHNVMFTTYCAVVASHPATLSRPTFGLLSWQVDAKVVHGFAMRWYNGNAMNDQDTTITDWCAMLPSWTGAPISTPVWEGVREGINDQRYLSLYAQLVKDGKADGALLAQLKGKGLEGLTLLPEKVVGDTVFGASIKNASDLEIGRDRVIDEIVKAMTKR
jgi:hypothetical protein